MLILRIFGALPPDLEVELYRETSGETVHWSGRASGVIEKFQGWALVAVGGAFALFNLAGPAAALGCLIDLLERGRAPEAGVLITVLTGFALFAAGAVMAVFGWRILQSADHVIWAVTDRRLLRMSVGGPFPVRSWTRDEIVKVDRLNWSDAKRRILAVTVKGRGDSNPVLMIMGPDDLDAAEAAIANIGA